MIHKILKQYAIIFLLMVAHQSLAIQEARSLPNDTRIKVIVYRSDQVYSYTGYYGLQSNIEFDKDEIISTITLGDSTAWQLSPANNRLFIKPIEENADTNMTIITDKRVYFFELHAKELTSFNDPELAFSIRFLYPAGDNSDDIANYKVATGVDLTRPEQYNFNYTISGNENLSPIRVFDDGQFTYFLFRSENTDIPAFFTVDDDGAEAIVNYRMNGEYVVIEKVAKRFSLRNGKEILCVFNESYLELAKAKKRKTLL